MKIHEKINKILKERKWRAIKLYTEIYNIYKKDSINPNTLYRALGGKHKLQKNSINQIAAALNIPLHELKNGTDYEKNNFIIYSYNNKAWLEEVLDNNKKNLPFVSRLVISGLSKTGMIQEEKNNVFKKCIFVEKGEIRLTAVCELSEDINLKKISQGEFFAFNNTYPHEFENASLRQSKVLIFYCPKEFELPPQKFTADS